MAQDPDKVTRRDLGRGTPTLAAKAPSSAVTTEEIRSQIEETRAEMTETIDALQERLSPGRLMTHAKETVKEATVGRMKNLAQKASKTAGDFARQTSETRAGFVHTVKENPIPVTLVALAATWLLVRAVKRPRNEPDRRNEWRPEQAAQGYRASAHGNAISGTIRNNARYLIAAGSGVACWGMWKARHSVVDRRQLSTASADARVPPAFPSVPSLREETR